MKPATSQLTSNPGTKHTITLLTALGLAPAAFAAEAAASSAPQWQEAELTFAVTRDTPNPYTDTEAWADFAHDDGTKIRRSMFWDGGRMFRVRFASSKSSGNWRWTATDRNGDPGIHGRSGTLPATANRAATPTHFSTHGFSSIPPDLTWDFCYWALFSGAFGHTYGCNEVWQMWDTRRQALLGADRPWHEAIHLPGAGQMRHARTLIESGPYFERMPDASLVAPPNATGPDYVAACRATDARYALIYFPSGKPATIRTFLLKGPRLAAQWLDPRTGERRDLSPIEVAPWKTTEFKPPVADQDWVLVLDRGRGGARAPAAVHAQGAVRRQPGRTGGHLRAAAAKRSRSVPSPG